MGLFKKIKFISAVCPNCKGNLELDANLETAFCQYCGAQCIVENAPKKQRKQTKLEIVLDFVERQQSLRRKDKQDEQRKREYAIEKRERERKAEEERQRKLLKKYWWVYTLIFVGVITLCIVMSILEKQGIL